MNAMESGDRQSNPHLNVYPSPYFYYYHSLKYSQSFLSQNLVHGRFDPAVVKHSSDLFAIEVGESNGSAETLVNKLLEGLPSLQIIHV